MSLFSNMNIDQIIDIIEKDGSKINEFDFSSFYERNLLAELVGKYPRYFTLIKKENLFEDIGLSILETMPQMFIKFPKNLRTTKVKLRLLEKNPEMIEFFEFGDFDYDIVKFMYVNYPFLIEDFEDKKTAKKVNSIIKQLKKDKIQPNNFETEEEEE